MLRRFCALFFLLTLVGNAYVYSQSAQLAPAFTDSYHLIDRLEIKSGSLSNDFHSNVKPFQRKQIADFLARIDTVQNVNINPIDRWNINYLSIDNWEFLDSTDQFIADSKKPILKHIYQKKNDLYYYKDNEFDIHVSPIFSFGGGSNSTDLEDKRKQFINTRGVEIRGVVGKKLGFYTYFTENQASSPAFVRDYSLAANSFAYYGLTKITKDDSVKLQRDYLGAEGYIVFQPSKHFAFRFGHAKNFIGSGVRSIILSDFSAPYLQFNAEVKLGRLQYYNIFASLTDTQIPRPIDNTVTIPSKFMAFHHLNINVLKNLNVGLFEKVMFGRQNKIFDLNYVNPIIFYRFVEGYLGSSDNALVGFDFKYNFLRSFSLYGQYTIDEFNSAEFKKDGWWGKKNAGQVGLKYIDVLGIKQLDFQVEYNYARPYTFTHYSSVSNGVHAGMPLGHQLGANFREGLFRFNYQPTSKLQLQGTYISYIKGFDSDSTNYGGDIQKNNRKGRPSDYGNYIGQGVERIVNLGELRGSYMLRHNLFLDLTYLKRNVQESGATIENENLFKFGVRFNFGQEPYLF
ncbi:hypothetical protein SAMN06298216_2917 [Spirosomataceae bacterium TFI 002]|nr:hypothetical protein SAMN06298216_2917 [Spirosomataceae bacterium TFI 002]